MRILSSEEMNYVNKRSVAAGVRVELAVAALENLKSDALVVEREAWQHCKACFYLRGPDAAVPEGIGYRCALCGEYGSTPLAKAPELCKACAKDNNLCVSCHGSMDMKDRRMKVLKKHRRIV